MNQTATCRNCHQPIEYNSTKGWFHSNGGGIYMMKCDNCKYKAALYPSPVKCPNCGSEKDWKDDHCVQKK